MAKELIWLHDKALDKHHPALQNRDDPSPCLFVWDEAYFQKQGYSFKRLVFIYETICEMSVTVVKGDTCEVIRSFAPDKVTCFFTPDIIVKEIIQQLSRLYPVTVIKPDPFVQLPESADFTRFFKYWNKAKETAFLSSKDINA